MKNERVENIIIVILSILNLVIAYTITTSLNIQNIILYKSYTASNYMITYESIIWLVLMLICASILELAKKGCLSQEKP